MRKRISNWEGGVRKFQNCAEFESDFGAGHYFDGLLAQQELEWHLFEVMGTPTITTSRGMTAISSVLSALTTAKDAVACSEDVYPGTRGLLTEWQKAGRLRQINWFDPSDIDEVLVTGAKLVFTETFGNAKWMRIADIPRICSLCHDHRAWLVVDTTFTPFFRPQIWSARLVVVGSMTKYWQSGDELMGGMISANRETIGRISATRVFQNSRMLPQIASDYLHVAISRSEVYERYNCQCRHTQLLAELCAGHQAVEGVWYPGLKEHPQHELVLRDYCGQGGGTLYLQLKGGEPAARQVADWLAAEKNDWHIAVSFAANDWRILPWVGALRQRVDCDGLLRVSPGRAMPGPNISAFKKALDSLKK